MFQKPEHGIQEELYKALVVAKKLGLVEDEECRWDEPLNRAEAVELLTKVYIAQNELYGYLSTVEYGKMKETKLGNEQFGGVEVGESNNEEANEVAAEEKFNEAMAPVDPNKELSSGVTLGEAKFVIEDVRRVLRAAAESEQEIEAEVRKIAEELGTTIEEVDKVIIADKSSDDKNVASETGKGSSKTGGNKGSSKTGGNKGSSKTGGNKSSGSKSSGGNKSGGSSGGSGSSGYIPPEDRRPKDAEDLDKYNPAKQGGTHRVVPPKLDAGFHAPGEEPNR